MKSLLKRTGRLNTVQERGGTVGGLGGLEYDVRWSLAGICLYLLVSLSCDLYCKHDSEALCETGSNVKYNLGFFRLSHFTLWCQRKL